MVLVNRPAEEDSAGRSTRRPFIVVGVALVAAAVLIWLPGWIPPSGRHESPAAVDEDLISVDDPALAEALAEGAVDALDSVFFATDDDIFSGADIDVSGALRGRYRLESTFGGAIVFVTEPESGRLGAALPKESLGIHARFDGQGLQLSIDSHHSTVRPGVREILQATVVLTAPGLTYTNTSGVCEIEFSAQVWKLTESEANGTVQTTWAVGTLWCTDLTEIRTGELISFEARFRVARESWLALPLWLP